MDPARFGLLLGFAGLLPALVWALGLWPSTPVAEIAAPAVQTVWTVQALLIALLAPPLAVEQRLRDGVSGLFAGLAIPVPIGVLVWSTGGADVEWLLQGELWTLAVSTVVIVCAWGALWSIPGWRRQIVWPQSLGVVLATAVWSWRYASGMPVL
jgi:hypothetical protein